MPILQWDNALNIGLPSIDEQHRQLVAMLNRLYDAMQDGAAQSELRELLAGLGAYTAQHFTDEEVHMRSVGFAGLEEHHREHERLKQRVADYQQRIQNDDAAITEEIMDFLCDWLMDHIQDMDQRIPAGAPDATVKAQN